MTEATDTWSKRLIPAGCAVVIVIGAIAIGEHGNGGSSTASRSPSGPLTPPVAAAPTPSPSGTHARSSAVPTPTETIRPPQTTMPSTGPHLTSVPVTPAAPVPAKPRSEATPAATATPTEQATTAPAASSRAIAAATIPPSVLGKFRYATTGYEQTTIPGTKRSFPSTTTITNRRAGCGVQSTWKPNSQHVQTQELCPDGTTIYMASYGTTLSFFGVSAGESFKCGKSAVIYQPGVKAGHVWRYKCTSSDATASEVAHVIGYSTMSVGGAQVRVLHVRVGVTLSGAESGTSTQEYWIETAKPILVKEKGTVDASQQNVRYQEKYSLKLDSTS
ncbi:MAG TPA: hypothetical protein VHB69_08520 [Mycobacteriales bacterium]|nr:hypothetical protein [Mycobacteriales bacterium]